MTSTEGKSIKDLYFNDNKIRKEIQIMKKIDIEIIGTMLTMILLIVGYMFGWIWQIVIPFYALFIVPTLIYIIKGNTKKCKKN